MITKHERGRPDRTLNPFAHYYRRMPDPYAVERLPEPPVTVEWGARDENSRPTMGERLFPGCDCGAARNGDFDRCTCY